MIFLYVAIGIAVGIIAVVLFSRRGGQQFLLLNQRFDTLAQNMQYITENTHKALRDTIQLISMQLKESRESMERSTQNVHRQVEGFTQGVTALQENVKQMHDSVRNVASFQEIFKVPKLRGQWGEMSLEAALGQFFPRDRYLLQHMFKSGEAVDAALRLPNDLILPIDAKFPFENFERMVHAENEQSKEFYRKAFWQDAKREIDTIASKYILPHEGTVDRALMYVPAESVYYELINSMKDVDIAQYAFSKKVILVSPNTFNLTLAALHHWFRDVQISKRAQDILKKLDRIAIDGHKLGEDFRRLGKHLSDSQSAYTSSEKRLGLMLDRVETVVDEEKENKEEKEEKEERTEESQQEVNTV